MRGPIVVGGLGGSGTRVVAQLLDEMRVYRAGEQNPPLDNLWFTLIFVRPHWYRQATPQQRQMALATFTALMTGQPLNMTNWQIILSAMLEHIRGRGIAGRSVLSRLLWILRRIPALFSHRQMPTAARAWGWKEPNSHIYLPDLAGYFPDLRYIHVMRHGLDMAYSNNRTQLSNWGWKFGLPSDTSPQTQLEYWVQANEYAVEQGRKLLGDRFYLLNFDALCLSPEAEILKLLAFLGVDRAEVDLAAMTAAPRVPSSMGRYQNQDISEFDPALVQRVAALGFTVQQG